MTRNRATEPDALAAELLRLAVEPEGHALRELRQRLDQQPLAEREAQFDAVRDALLKLARNAPLQALGAADEVLRLGRALPTRRALAERAVGTGLHLAGRSAEALPHFLRAEALHEADGEEVELLRTRRSLVDVHQMSGDAPAALEVADRARTLGERLGERTLLAQLECNVGNVHFRLDAYKRAAGHYERAIELFRELGDETGRAYAEVNLGNIETNAARFDRAKECFEGARAAFEAAGLGVLAAEARYGRAYLEFRRGRFSEARRRLEQVREEFLRCGKPAGAPLCDMDLAELHLRLDAYRDAVLHADRAAEAFAELDLTYERARSTLFGGLARAQLGDISAAREKLLAAENLLTGLGNRTLSALAALHRAELDRDANPRLALANVEAAASRLAESGDAFLGDLGRLLLADALARVGEADEASALLRSLLAADERPDRSLQVQLRIDALLILGELQQERGDRNAARRSYERAIGAIEGTYSSIVQSDARLAFFRGRQEAFARLAGLLLAEGAPEEAMRLVESSRLRSSLERAGVRPASGAPRSEPVNELRGELDGLLRRRLDEAVAPPSSGNSLRQPAALDERIAELQDRLHALLRRDVPEISPAGAAAGRSAPTGELLGAALDPREHLAYYVESGEALHLVHGRAGRLETVRLDAPRRAVDTAIDRLRFQLETLRHDPAFLSRRSKSLARSVRRLLEELGSVLIEPLTDALDGAPFVVVPYGRLHEVPFQALVVRGRHLVEHAPVSYARSLRQLAACRALPPTSPGAPVVACIADDPSLPGLAPERFALRATYGERLLELEPAALFEHLESGAERAALHLAAHGAYRPDHPLFSSLQLGDRFLTPYDLMRMRLCGEVVVLSGCETGRQLRTRAEDLFGPEPSFLAAGARTVVSSLWPVVDETTADFMARLARAWRTGSSVRSAVTDVQRSMLAEGAAPHAWAPFVACGDPDARLI